MTLCDRAVKIKVGFEREQKSFRENAATATTQGMVEGMLNMESGSKRAMARALNRHVGKCRVCG